MLLNPFLQLSLIAALLASLAGGILGSYVVVKRISNLCGSIAHSVLGGMGFFLWLQRVWGFSWCDPLAGAFLTAVLSAWLIGWIHLRFRQREDAVIAAIWSTGMAIGVIFLSLTPGSTAELTGFLLGSLMWISPADLMWLGGLNVVILLTVCAFYRSFLAVCFDEEQALLQQIPVSKIYFLLLTLIALSIVLLIQMIGTILALALLTLPATVSSLFNRRLAPLMIGAVCCSLFCSGMGIALSYQFDWPPGATIALLAAFCYFSALGISKRPLLKRIFNDS